MIYWLLAREVLVLRGELEQDQDWDVVVDLFYYKVETEQVAQKAVPGTVDVEEKNEENLNGDNTEKKEDADEKWE